MAPPKRISLLSTMFLVLCTSSLLLLVFLFLLLMTVTVASTVTSTRDLWSIFSRSPRGRTFWLRGCPAARMALPSAGLRFHYLLGLWSSWGKVWLLLFFRLLVKELLTTTRRGFPA